MDPYKPINCQKCGAEQVCLNIVQRKLNSVDFCANNLENVENKSKLKIPKISENSHPFKIPETFHGKFPKFPETFQPFASLPTPLYVHCDISCRVQSYLIEDWQLTDSEFGNF